MESLVGTYGYPVLFLVSFLAATVLPLGSEWLLCAMVLKGFAPAAVVMTATAGNYLGGCTTYLIGIYGGPFLIQRVLRIDARSRHKAEYFFRRYGSYSLLLSWLPVIGDPLCLVGGILGVSFARFSVLVIAGKLARYAVLAYALAGSASF